MDVVGWEGLFEAQVNSRQGKSIDWGVYAKAYDLLPHVFPEYRENIEIVTNELKRHVHDSNARVCDLGAGTGVYTEHLARNFPTWKFTHVDSNPGMNRVARAKYKSYPFDQIALIEDSAQTVRFPSEVFDAVICVNALYAMNPQQQIIKKVLRWLKRGGVFICIDFGRRQKPGDWLIEFGRNALSLKIEPATTMKALAVTSNVLVQAIRGSAGQGSGEYWMHDLDEFKETIEECGFEIQKGFVCYRGYCDGVVARKD